MKVSEVKSATQTISNFIRDISLYEEDLREAAPDVWGYILSALRMLSDSSKFLEASAGYSVSQQLMDYAPLFAANGIDINKIEHLPKSLVNQDCDVLFPAVSSS